ncbi:hypothetical protein LIP66_05225 [Coprococcus eutactus]|jgi:hypothetical protein|uniref:hypothetical protein n=1 Tax=Clostridia TaxID=186801 RepID=UPI000E498701|nr:MULTISPECIES: hypothetical protein [Clostridia]MCB5504038.1 hypothetical protein [Coprococcus eutactus]NSC95855.1 hypothetical protein [Coprococcus eutactus]NSD35110.1 hypothetical protein [Coprococcus eutactus]RHV12112.1 hypothetical protein DXB77_06965 [Clostridium sp. OM05-9]
MRYLDRLIASEVLPNAYKEWRGYRQKLTDFIEENCVAEGGRKPVLAIWGAGRSNDIDLARLAERFKLVLIDRDAEGLAQACKAYGLEETDAICVDLPFWNVELETYEMFEALLAEGEEAEIVIEHLKQVAFDNSHRVLPDIGRRFDYSVCIGLHSQLNARFAGLLYMYRENYDEEELQMIENAIRALNEAAVTRTNDVIYMLTEKLMVFGLEWAVVNESAMEQWEKLVPEDIEGALQLRHDIGMHKDFDIRIEAERRLFWPFAWKERKKGYVMELLAVQPLE